MTNEVIPNSTEECPYKVGPESFSSFEDLLTYRAWFENRCDL